MASINITGDGDNVVTVNQGHAFSVGVSGTLDGTIAVQYAKEDPAAASYTTSLTGTDNDLIFTAVKAGTEGNSLTIAYIDPSANNAALSLDWTYPDLVVNLATGAGGAITSTADDIAAAVAADEVVARYFSVANAAANDGSGVVTALAEQSLASGTAGTFTTIQSGDTGSFTAAGERVFVNLGTLDKINLNTSSTTSTDADVVVVDLGNYANK